MDFHICLLPALFPHVVILANMIKFANKSLLVRRLVQGVWVVHLVTILESLK